jgi:hypothetical protein
MEHLNDSRNTIDIAGEGNTQREAHDERADKIGGLKTPGLASSQETILRWLAQFGFDFNPFNYTESEREPYLAQYYVEHPAFAGNRRAEHGFLFSDPGTGKTATRLRLAYDFQQRFPLEKVLAFSYIIPADQAIKPRQSLSHHLPGLLASAVREAFVLFARCGDHLQQLIDQDSARALAAYFDAYYPIHDWQVDLQESMAQHSLHPVLSTLALPADDTVDARWLQQWLRLLTPTSGNAKPGGALPSSVRQRWDGWRALMFRIGVTGMVVLVDGVDTNPGPDPTARMTRLALPFAQASQLAANPLGAGVFIKLFLPRQVYAPLMAALRAQPPVYFIAWDNHSLNRLLRARLSIASHGNVNYLTELFDARVPGLEDYLFDEAGHSPRDLLLLINDLLRWHAETDAKNGNMARISLRTLARFAERKPVRGRLPC